MAKKQKEQQGPKASKQTENAPQQWPLRVLKAYRHEVMALLDKADNPLDLADYSQLASFSAYSLLVFMQDYADKNPDGAAVAILRQQLNPGAGGGRQFDFLCQTVIFDLFAPFDLSRETIRRLLIILAKHQLIDRQSKGPPFPDQLSIAKKGSKLLARSIKRAASDEGALDGFAYL